MNLSRDDATHPNADPIPLEDLLRHAVAIGAVLVLLLPAARGFSDTLGWIPLWLIAMPLCAWWALHRFGLPASERRAEVQSGPRHRSGDPARRWRSVSSRRKHSQAA